MRRMGKLLITLTQRVGHYPDNRSILTFLILTTRVERVPRPVRIALRDTKQGGQRLFTRHASRLFTLLLPNPQLRQPRHDLDRLQADADHLAEQAQDVLRIVGAVGVVDDAAAFVGLDAVLVDHPFEGGAVAEAVGGRAEMWGPGARRSRAYCRAVRPGRARRSRILLACGWV